MIPVLASVPHAGLWIPPEARPYCILTPEEVAADGDVGAATSYEFASDTAAYVRTDVARAIVDMNRAPDDIRKDGVVKTHTCWDVPVWSVEVPRALGPRLVAKYHASYHRRLEEAAREKGLLVGIDLHTMAARAPPEAPDPGAWRPPICVSDAGGTTMPADWSRLLREELERAFEVAVSHDRPFNGGHIIRHHAQWLPWAQIELSRDPWIDWDEKRSRVRQALAAFCERAAHIPLPNRRR